MENTKTLYFNGWKFNAARLLQRIEKLVFDNGGAIVSTWEKELNTYNLIPTTTNYKFETTTYKDKAITTNYINYINFVLDGCIYYIDFDDNPFFNHYFSKIPVKEDLKIVYKHYINDLNRDFMFDCLFDINCSYEEIKEIANLIFNQILTAKNSQIVTTRRRRYYNGNKYYYENVPDKEPGYKQQYFIIKEF